MIERQRDRETERQRDRETERQRDRETKRQRDREAERQRDREIEKDREAIIDTVRERERDTGRGRKRGRKRGGGSEGLFCRALFPKTLSFPLSLSQPLSLSLSVSLLLPALMPCSSPHDFDLTFAFFFFFFSPSVLNASSPISRRDIEASTSPGICLHTYNTSVFRHTIQYNYGGFFSNLFPLYFFFCSPPLLILKHVLSNQPP